MFGNLEILSVFLEETNTEYNEEDFDTIGDRILFEMYCSPQD